MEIKLKTLENTQIDLCVSPVQSWGGAKGWASSQGKLMDTQWRGAIWEVWETSVTEPPTMPLPVFPEENGPPHPPAQSHGVDKGTRLWSLGCLRPCCTALPRRLRLVAAKPTCPIWPVSSLSTTLTRPRWVQDAPGLPSGCGAKRQAGPIAGCKIWETESVG